VAELAQYFDDLTTQHERSQVPAPRQWADHDFPPVGQKPEDEMEVAEAVAPSGAAPPAPPTAVQVPCPTDEELDGATPMDQTQSLAVANGMAEIQGAQGPEAKKARAAAMAAEAAAGATGATDAKLAGVVIEAPGVPTFGLVSAYFQASAGLNETNLHLLATLGQTQDLVGKPLLVAGDFNLQPERLQKGTDFLTRATMAVAAPKAATYYTKKT
ncbi:unnamed protein product, partial [Prorocentrum cordatum]